MLISSIITPEQIDDTVLLFCSQISKSKPFYVEVAPTPESKPLFCFPNVYEAIKKNGGECLHGWQIWVNPNLFIEAEFHGVWKKANSEIIDVTPKSNNAQKILFLPDQSKIYENKQVNNIRKPLSKNGLIPHFFLTFDALFALYNFGSREYETEIKFIDEEAEIHQWLIRCQISLEKMIKEGKTKNSKCPCASNMKYKRCCGKSFESNIKLLKNKYNF